MKIDPKAPAFTYGGKDRGIDVRTYIATQMLAPLVMQDRVGGWSKEERVDRAVLFTDLLIKRLNEDQA